MTATSLTVPGYEPYRGDLGLMYFATVAPADGRLVGLRLVPTQLRRFRVERAPQSDVQWLRETLDREGAPVRQPCCRRSGPDPPTDQLLDLTAGWQRYIEDCEVCCNPIAVSYETEAGRVVSFRAELP